MATNPLETAGRSPDAIPENEKPLVEPKKLVRVQTGMKLFATMPGGPDMKKTAALKVYKEMENVAMNALDASKMNLEAAIQAAKTNVALMPAEFADLKEFLQTEVLPGLAFDVPAVGKEVDDDAPYLDRSGRLELGELERVRQRINATLHSPLGRDPAVAAALECTLAAIAAYESRQNTLLCYLRPNVEPARLARVSQTEAKENFVFKLAFVALTGILGTTTLAISLFSKGEKNLKAPAIYFGLAAAAAMGKKWLAPSDVADAREIVNAVGEPGGTFDTLAGKYCIAGKAWLDVVKKMRDIDIGDTELNAEKVLNLLKPDPTIEADVKRLVSNEADFKLFSRFLQKSWSDRTNKFIDGMVEEGINRKIVLDKMKALPPITKN